MACDELTSKEVGRYLFWLKMIHARIYNTKHKFWFLDIQFLIPNLYNNVEKLKIFKYLKSEGEFQGLHDPLLD